MEKCSVSLRNIRIHNSFIVLFMALSLVGCKTDKGQPKGSETEQKVVYKKGSFGYDKAFLSGHYKDLVVLENGVSSVLVSPELQGRVMTSTAGGDDGQSFGWINYDLIASGESKEHFNPTGGEERFWLGPEGGQFSLYFKKGARFEFQDWYVPKELDTEPFSLVGSTKEEARFEREMKLENYSGTIFNLLVQRTISLIGKDQASEELGVLIPDGVSMVGFASENSITNIGSQDWTKETGMPSIWILSMLNSSDETTITIPFKKGSRSELGKKVTDDYFGKVSQDRLKVMDSVLFFKADGQSRGKIGISPERALPVLGSYDAKNKVLTIAKFSLPEGRTDYVNSLWEIQEQPFKGDAVNAYNDGPLEDGGQLGPFYELESSSPALALKSGERDTHRHQTYHFIGDVKHLDVLSKEILGVPINEIEIKE
ncbi:DUF6786 family protein [Arenibacter aquaticus]|uniref:DUF6786 family protein n=1 Tax=Arenibacter aquaticus TaxID=2489054 RepID=UPI00192E5454|nr:DUF6786 family protein [Arenibacter aquaticus]